jgi:hypothetical protein
VAERFLENQQRRKCIPLRDNNIHFAATPVGPQWGHNGATRAATERWPSG